FNTSTGNPVKKILRKLNLSDHRSILTDLKAIEKWWWRFDKQALETELTQLKDALTSVRIQIDGYKAVTFLIFVSLYDSINDHYLF
ncbi:hypothetical protein Tco_0258670, partial [Tanacetum coccineum]